MSILFDIFTLNNTKKFTSRDRCVFVLSHAHLDHARIPKNFAYVILCTAETKSLLPNVAQLRGVLIPGWNSCKDLEFYVFKTDHCFGSIGIWYDGVLYHGDGRFTTKVEQQIISNVPKINHIVGDNFLPSLGYTAYERPYSLPGRQQTICTMKETLDSLCHISGGLNIVLHNFASVDALPPPGLNWYYKIDDLRKKSTDCLTIRVHSFLHKYRHTNKPTNFCISLSSSVSKSKRNIIPSATFFLISEGRIDVAVPQTDRNGDIRIFYLTHADLSEIQRMEDLLIKA